MDPDADKGDWTLDGLKKLMGAIYPEAVRQAQAERDLQLQAMQARLLQPLHSWRARTPAEVADYDRRFLHVLGITPL